MLKFTILKPTKVKLAIKLEFINFWKFVTRIPFTYLLDIAVHIIDVTKVDATKVNVLYTHAQLNILYGQPKLLYTPIRY